MRRIVSKESLLVSRPITNCRSTDIYSWNKVDEFVEQSRRVCLTKSTSLFNKVDDFVFQSNMLCNLIQYPFLSNRSFPAPQTTHPCSSNRSSLLLKPLFLPPQSKTSCITVGLVFICFPCFSLFFKAKHQSVIRFSVRSRCSEGVLFLARVI